jgi:DNA excision repair protein ERCC-4
LTTYDCVSFYSFIETIIAANSPQEGRQAQPSPWLLSDSGSNAIKAARKRVFLKKGDPEFDSYPSNEDPDIPKDKKLVLEEQPKWNLLKTILNEIEHDSITLNDGEGAPVLIMVTEKRTCSQLKHYITTEIHENSHQPFLKRLAKNYFKWNKSMNRMQPTPPTPANANQARFNNRGGPPNKRRRVRGGSSSASTPGRPQQNLADTFQQEIIDVLDNDDDNNDEEDENTFQGIGPLTDAYEIERQQDDILPTFEEISPNSLATVQCYDNDINEQTLQDTQPRFIIMFDPNPSFVRQIEVYRASHPSIQMRVYFMMYENSVEEQSYLSLIRKEKESFEKLIHEKSVSLMYFYKIDIFSNLYLRLWLFLYQISVSREKMKLSDRVQELLEVKLKLQKDLKLLQWICVNFVVRYLLFYMQKV